VDTTAFLKENKSDHDIFSVFDDGGFGIRIGSYNNPYFYDGFELIANTNNAEDTHEDGCGFGQVSYEYMIKQNLITNSEYCEFLNSADPLGLNELDLYHNDMNNHITGGISFDDCGGYGLKYSAKPFMHNKPVTFVSWLKAAKYVNWLNNNIALETYINLSNYSAAADWVNTNIFVNNNNTR
jgi:hypothetical protein